MQRGFLSIAGILLFALAPLHGQSPSPSILGTWQGTLSLPNDRTSRIVFVIEKKPDGSLHGGIKYIDNNFGLLFTSISFSAPDVTLTPEMTGMTFHGQLSADGKSITGTLGQGKNSLPITLSLATPDTLWKAAGPPPMAANADPSYEVAIIKPAPPEEQHPIWNLTATEFHATGMSAAELIKLVYGVRGRQLINMPHWVEDTKFDIIAKPDTPGVPTEGQSLIMIRKLLADRFHFVGHTGTQDFPALVMTLDPKGPRPQPSDPSFTIHNGMIYQQDGGDLVLHLTDADMPFFLKTLMDRYRDKQIVDETGLTGAYDITLRVSGAASKTETGSGGTDDEIGVAYLAAAEKAGFKFTSKKAPIPVVFIDHIDPPTPN